ncbi:MAG: prepilin-type N-terminal cleavage/methylation domain-containing protein [Actinomycetota bacterium]
MARFGRLGRDEGFTLMELMMVIAIIGVLVGIAVASYAISVSTSKKTACKANLRTVEEQIVVYHTHHDAYPPTLQDLVPDLIENDGSLYCPESGEAYLYDDSSGDVSCPYHKDL